MTVLLKATELQDIVRRIAKLEQQADQGEQ